MGEAKMNSVAQPLHPRRQDGVAVTSQLVRQVRQGGGAAGDCEAARLPHQLPRWLQRSRLLVAGHQVHRGEGSEIGPSAPTRTHKMSANIWIDVPDAV